MGMVVLPLLISSPRPAAFTGLLRLFSVFGQLDTNEDDPDAGITQIDYEEQTAGYQASYSKLSASENPRPDPASYAPDAKKFVMGELAKALQSADQPTFQNLLQQCDVAVVQPFAAEMSSVGFRI
jgi:exportin-2 (importin alpha re-exporter)